MKKKIEHKGIWQKRRKSNAREEAFASQWEKENEPHGYPTQMELLQMLFIEGSTTFDPFGEVKVIEEINERDARIVATVMQWLGSNCGMSFIEESLKKCGYRISRPERLP